MRSTLCTRMRQRPRDGRSGLPPTTLDHVSVTKLSPTSPLRSWVSAVGTIHCQNTTGWHLSTGVGERVLTNGLSNYYEHFSSSPPGLAMGVDVGSLNYHGATRNRLRASWYVPHTKPHPTTHYAAAAACVLNARAPLGVTHHTRTSVRARRAPQPRHAHCPRILRAGRVARSQTSRVSCLGSLSSSCRRSCVWVFYRRGKRRQAPW